MKSRYNSSQPLPGRDYPIRYQFTVPPRQPERSSKPAQKLASHTNQTTPDTSPPQSTLYLEQEISSEELNEFAGWIFSQLSEAGAGYPVDTIFNKALTQKLESYVSLKRDYTATLEAQGEHLQWSERVVKAAEPVLKNQAIPEEQKQDLSALAVSCIEKTWQLNMRVENIRLRVEFLDQALPLYLTEYGQQLDTPAQELEEIALQLSDFLKQSI